MNRFLYLAILICTLFSKALQSFGTNHILTTYLQGMMGQDSTPNLPSDVRELQYEAAWKMGQWDLDVPTK